MNRNSQKLFRLIEMAKKKYQMYQSVAYLTSDPDLQVRMPARSDHITFIEIDHEIIHMAILSFLLIHEGQLSVTGKSLCTKYWLKNQF